MIIGLKVDFGFNFESMNAVSLVEVGLTSWDQGSKSMSRVEWENLTGAWL